MRIFILLVALMLGGGVSSANAAPIFFSGTGNYYDFIARSFTWDNARIDAGTKMYLGTPGHLATLTTFEEDNFIRTTFSYQVNQYLGPWFGAKWHGSGTGPTGGWSWVTGETFSYTGWNPGEPNHLDFGGGLEDAIHFSDGGWNDIFRNRTDAIGYFIEYESTAGKILSYSGDVLVNGVPVVGLPWKIKPFDKVKTLSNSSVEIKISEKTINLDQNSKMKIEGTSTPTITVFEEVYGRLRVKIKRHSGEDVEIRMPVAIWGVRGTEVVVEATQDESEIILLEGEADVSTTDASESIVLDELQGVIVTADGIGEPFAVSPNEIERWWERMVVFVASPVDLYVTDPLGRHTGMSPLGEMVNEIPGATYTGPDAVPEEISIPNPAWGSYGIDLLAIGTGSYNLSVACMGLGDQTFFEEHSGSVETGQVISYQASYEQTEVPKQVLIDIKPSSFPNTINLKSKGVIPVAILTTEDFDATIVDPLSVEFGQDGAIEAHGKGHIEDVDEDGDLDLVLHFTTKDTGIVCGDTSTYLSGFTFDGYEIEGYDSITTVGCN